MSWLGSSLDFDPWNLPSFAILLPRFCNEWPTLNALSQYLTHSRWPSNKVASWEQGMVNRRDGWTHYFSSLVLGRVVPDIKSPNRIHSSGERKPSSLFGFQRRGLRVSPGHQCELEPCYLWFLDQLHQHRLELLRTAESPDLLSRNLHGNKIPRWSVGMIAVGPQGGRSGRPEMLGASLIPPVPFRFLSLTQTWICVSI